MKKLFTPKQIGMATFFGGPLAAVFMISKNYLEVGQQKMVNKVKKMGYGITIAIYFGLLFLPDDRYTRFASTALLSVIGFYLAHTLQQKIIVQKIEIEKTHTKENLKNTIWMTLWAGIVTIAIAVAFGLIYVLVNVFILHIPLDQI